MLARINERRRVTLVDERGWILENVQRDWALKILIEQKGFSRPQALAIVHTGVSDAEWMPAYRNAKDKQHVPN